LRYLDKFVDLSAAKLDESQAREELLVSQQSIEKARQQVALIPSYEQRLNVANAQLTALEMANAKEVIALQRQLFAGFCRMFCGSNYVGSASE